MVSIKTLLEQQSPPIVLQSVSVAGYAAPAQVQGGDATELARMAALAEAILADPQALAQFSDRVYDRLEQDMGLMQERAGYSRRTRM
ncbi:MAG: hypothetical protein HC812_00945 [Leptolyngbya sp. RL_3_1]|nr:hypothetical protein [Leptolyngbya sp. RL_3_1]